MNRGHSHLRSHLCGSSIENDPIQNLVFFQCAFVLFWFRCFCFVTVGALVPCIATVSDGKLQALRWNILLIPRFAFVLVTLGAVLDIWIGGLVFVCLIVVIFIFAKSLVYLCSTIAALEQTSHLPFSFSFRWCFMFYLSPMVRLTFGSIFFWFWLVCGLLVYVVPAVVAF